MAQASADAFHEAAVHASPLEIKNARHATHSRSLAEECYEDLAIDPVPRTPIGGPCKRGGKALARVRAVHLDSRAWMRARAARHSMPTTAKINSQGNNWARCR